MKEIPKLQTSEWIPYCSPEILSGCKKREGSLWVNVSYLLQRSHIYHELSWGREPATFAQHFMNNKAIWYAYVYYVDDI